MKLTIDQILEKAITAHQEGKLEEAERLYREILEIEPTQLDANNNLGVLLQSSNRLEEAEKSYKKAIELKPDYAEAHYNLGNIQKNFSRLEEAEKSYKKSIEFKPDYAQAYYNLGSLQKEFIRLHEAEINLKKAIELKPDYAEAHHGLGNILNDLGKFDKAEISYKKAIQLNPDFVEAHHGLGNTFQATGRLDEAEISYKKAIELKPGFTMALMSKGLILFVKGKYELALKDFDACDSIDSRPRSLYTLYALGRTEEIYQRINQQSKIDDKNLKVAAFSSFIFNKEKRETEHNFCNNPINFIYNSNLKLHLKNSNLFINDVIEELKSVDTYWEPYGKSTTKGSQSMGNLFKNPSEKLQKLKSIIFNEIDAYYLKFKDSDCSFIKKWPLKKNIQGWHVILKQQGYQNAHIHSGGWLSGVIYLKVVPSIDKNEGAIEFSLNGERYFDVNSPYVIHKPKIGDIVFFPSSLHHRTIPFTTDDDRITISFDLIPFSENY